MGVTAGAPAHAVPTRPHDGAADFPDGAGSVAQWCPDCWDSTAGGARRYAGSVRTRSRGDRRNPVRLARHPPRRWSSHAVPRLSPRCSATSQSSPAARTLGFPPPSRVVRRRRSPPLPSTTSPSFSSRPSRCRRSWPHRTGRWTSSLNRQRTTRAQLSSRSSRHPSSGGRGTLEDDEGAGVRDDEAESPTFAPTPGPADSTNTLVRPEASVPTLQRGAALPVASALPVRSPTSEHLRADRIGAAGASLPAPTGATATTDDPLAKSTASDPAVRAPHDTGEQAPSNIQPPDIQRSTKPSNPEPPTPAPGSLTGSAGVVGTARRGLGRPRLGLGAPLASVPDSSGGSSPEVFGPESRAQSMEAAEAPAPSMPLPLLPVAQRATPAWEDPPWSESSDSNHPVAAPENGATTVDIPGVEGSTGAPVPASPPSGSNRASDGASAATGSERPEPTTPGPRPLEVARAASFPVQRRHSDSHAESVPGEESTKAEAGERSDLHSGSRILGAVVLPGTLNMVAPETPTGTGPVGLPVLQRHPAGSEAADGTAGGDPAPADPDPDALPQAGSRSDAVEPEPARGEGETKRTATRATPTAAALQALPVVPLQRFSGPLAVVPAISSVPESRSSPTTPFTKGLGNPHDQPLSLTRVRADVGSDWTAPSLQRDLSESAAPGPSTPAPAGPGTLGLTVRPQPAGPAALVGLAVGRPSPAGHDAVVPSARVETATASEEDLRVQRSVDVPGAVPPLEQTLQRAQGATEVAGSAEGASVAAGTPESPEQMEELARKLFDPLMLRLRAELLVDRERRGLRTDSW